MITQPTTGRLILAGKAIMSDNTTPEPWIPPLLQTGPMPEPLDLTLPQEPEPSRKPQRQDPPAPHETVPISPNDTLEQMANNRPSDVAQAIRTVLLRDQNGSEAQKKVAVLILGLGTHLSAQVLRHCTEEDTQLATRALTELESITAREKDAICEEFRQILITGDYVLRAGKSYAFEVLQRAFSFSKAKWFLNQATGQPTSGFAMLNTIEANQIVPFISKEHPQTIALILSQLTPEKAASVLNGLYPPIQIAVMECLAKMDNISPQVLLELEGSLADGLQAILSSQITRIGGPEAVAKILTHTSQTIEKSIVENIEKKYPKLAEQIVRQLEEQGQMTLHSDKTEHSNEI
jgi:flagellar motor switch protein FliG